MMKKRVAELYKKYLKTPVAWEHEGDGCTGVLDFIFRGCCDKHDRAYARGGTEADRKLADKQFHYCMKETVKRNRLWVLRWAFFWPMSYWRYWAVRVAGKKHFNYHDRTTKDPWKDLGPWQ